ncbi:MAG: EAL domain-containing protein [Herminiimonas sp.]|nr:EAL domain-containing protein [Herminiimonas sp.]
MKRPLSLRTLLVLLAMTAVAPGIAVLVYSSVVVQRDEVVHARQELESVAKLVAANQEQLTEGVRQILVTIASGPSVRRYDLHDLCVEFLRNVQAATPAYANIGVLGLDGKIECQGRAGETGGDANGRQYFRNAIETGKFSVGTYMVGITSGRKAVGFGMPVYDYSGKLRGVAFAGLDLEYANRQLNSISLPKHLVIHVTDAAGRLLVSSSSAMALGEQLPDQAVQAAIAARRTGSFASTDAAGVEWLHATRPIGGVDRDALMVSVRVRKADAVALADSHFQVQLAIIGVASLAGILLALLFAQRGLAQPVRNLLGRMRRIEQSQAISSSDIAPAATTSREFAELEAGFSSMVARLQINQQQLLKAQELAGVGFFEFDMRSGTYWGSESTYRLYGLDPAWGPVSIATFRTLVHPDDLPMVVAHRDRMLAGAAPTRLQYRVVRPDGSLCWVDSFGTIEHDPDGRPILYSGAVQDITERMLSEQAARVHENRFQRLFENSLDGVLQTTPEGTILAANSAACRILGMSETQLQERGRNGLLVESDPRLKVMLDERAATGHTRGELTLMRADGSHFEVELSSTIYPDADGNSVCSMVLRDITDRIKAEQYIHRLAFFDALTELPNRRLLLDRLALLLASAQRNNRVGAVLFVDLDHFKNVNDARGHAVGDALLRDVAQRLSALMRAEDTVARIGGDEFVILMPDLAAEFTQGAQNAMSAAEKVRQALARPFDIDGQSYGSGCSIGVTLLPKTGQSTEDLLREADTAMYRAKTAGRNRIAFFESAMQAEVEEQFALQHDLAQALGTAQLEMAMQPQFDHAGQPVGCELLMRWTHPVRGPVSPALFIPAAEESGLILQLGNWVVHEGCLAVLRLQQAGRTMPVSINVSPRQFRQPDFVGRVRTILAETGAPASLLIFEVTEGLLIDNLDDTVRRMNELVAMGIRFSIDDFGTGYSSLGYLRRLPLYELKIDRSFIQDTPSDPGHTAIVQSILSMASHLRLRVVAEGVETVEQREFLRQSGCTFMQGYLLARPMSMDAWLESPAAAA